MTPLHTNRPMQSVACVLRASVCALLVVAQAASQANADPISSGLSCLAAHQNPNGSWGDLDGSGRRDTTVVLNTLGALGQTSSPSYTQGLAALQGLAAENNDYLARQVLSLAPATIDAFGLVTRLRDSQENAEPNPSVPNFPAGGWGAASGFATDTLDTALALRALRAAGFESGLTVVNEQVPAAATTAVHPFNFPAGATGLSILIRSTTGPIRLFFTTPASGTFSVDLTPGEVPVNQTGLPEETGTYSVEVENLDTVPISYALEARFTTADGFTVERISRALRYLGLAQNADGGWGIAPDEESSLMITTEVLLTLQGYGGSFAPRSAIDRGLDWLQTHQHPDGGFSADPGASSVYETALVVIALSGGGRNAGSILATPRSYLLSKQGLDGCWNDDAYSTALALRAVGLICLLDVDGNGTADLATDIVYIARRLLHLTSVVPPSFRILDPTIAADAVIAANIDAMSMALDVDSNGHNDVATDIVYIARWLLHIPQVVPPSFRTLDPTIPPDATVSTHIDASCP